MPAVSHRWLNCGVISRQSCHIGGGSHNKSVLKQISDDELKHYDFWKKYARQDANGTS
jgi:hypothetical protein